MRDDAQGLAMLQQRPRVATNVGRDFRVQGDENSTVYTVRWLLGESLVCKVTVVLIWWDYVCLEFFVSGSRNPLIRTYDRGIQCSEWIRVSLDPTYQRVHAQPQVDPKWPQQ